ncbi:MAG: CYTH domain-containing protein [Bacteroidota bacterium]|nr:CYTH domain-containing protein [Bacteroidota bacterium]
MAKEIERKFRVRNESFKAFSTGVLYRQGYLSRDIERTVRIRVSGENAFITIKGMTNGFERLEFEYPILLEDANQMLEAICIKPLIEKLRYKVMCNGHLWEVDEFIGDNEGLIVAEVELESNDEEVVIPDWIGEEVTGDPRYYNSNMVTNPFKNWSDIQTVR